MCSGETRLPVHTLTEARLYLKVTPCGHCGAGPFVYRISDTRVYGSTMKIPARCRHCGQMTTFNFDTSEIEGRGPLFARLDELREPTHLPAAQVINPTREPSRVIDVAGWLTLHMAISEKARAMAVEAETMAQRGAVRRLQIEAGHCVDEALKFYEEDNELPPDDAFFTPDSRDRYRQRPELFTRQRLVTLRRALPR